jgi:hypothetical protein
MVLNEILTPDPDNGTIFLKYKPEYVCKDIIESALLVCLE